MYIIAEIVSKLKLNLKSKFVRQHNILKFSINLYQGKKKCDPIFYFEVQIISHC